MKQLALLLLLASPLADAQIHKCITDGKTVYQEEPCARWEDRRLINDRMTIVESLDRRPVSRPEPPRRSVGGGVIGGGSSGEHSACPDLRERLAWIDSSARQRSTNWHRQERAKVKARLSRLGCSEIGR
jgi:hypothetical protein